MRLDRRFLLVVGFSLAWAFVVSAVFYRVARGAGGRAPAANEKSVVVATAPLALGTMLKADMVKVVRMPESLVPKGAFAKPEEVLDRTVVSPIQPEEPMLEARLAARGSGLGLAPLIPPGMRAISVRVNDVVGVAGFVLPGMRVDVLVTGRAPGRDESSTATVLQNVTVLSAGQTIEADAGHQAINAPVVTLLVTPQQAEALTLANNEGKIHLVLRNSTDQRVAETGGRQLHELYAVERRTAPDLPVAVPAPPRRHSETKTHPAASPAPVSDAMPAPATSEQAPAPAPADTPDTVVVIRGSQKTIEPVPGKGN
jgi:pilus assembly protein CpaB